MAATGATWAQLRQQARSLESQTESLLHTYSQYASLANIPAKPSEEELKTEDQLKDILERRETNLAALSRTLENDGQSSAIRSSHLSLHRSSLTQHRSDVSRLRSQISQARDRANLLSNVRKDISNYRAAEGQNPEAAEAEYMLGERRRIDNSHNMADSVLSQAYAVNESFSVQREALESIRRRITSAAGNVPGINGLIGRIGSKRRRDGIILGSFIAFCFLCLLYFM